MTTIHTQQPAQLLDSAAVADWLGVPVRTLDQWAYRGNGPRFAKIGKHRRYRIADVEQWLADRTVETA